MPVGSRACQAIGLAYAFLVTKAADPDKAERLAAALRANLARRKARDRAQAEGDAPTTPEPPAPPPRQP